MKVFVDVVCPSGHAEVDVWVERGGEMPSCSVCGDQTTRLWRTAPGITPLGTRPERGRNQTAPETVNTAAIALETQREIEAKWDRYSDKTIAEQAISREINHQAGMADEMGNPTPIPTPPPITFERPAA